MRFLFISFALLLSIASGFSQSRYISETTKKIVFARDAGICQCCGSSTKLEFDHIIPFSCGGNSEPSNIQLLCRKCNRSKSNSCYCKIHHKQVGHDCCSKENGGGSRGGFKGDGKKASAATQCTGITKKGTRCRNMTKNANGRCHHH